MKAARLLAVVTYVGAAASEYESDNAKPVDDKRQVYIYHWRGPRSIIISSGFPMLKRWSSIELSGAGSGVGRSICSGGWCGRGTLVGIGIALGGGFHA